MRIERLDIQVLRPYWRNPRNIEGAVEATTKSIKDYGYNAPIVVDEDYTIIVGHTRYRALQRLGYQKVDCVVTDLSPQKAREYRIADNKTAEIAEWDEEKLIKELMQIEDPEFAHSYFTDQEVAQLLPQDEEVPQEAGLPPGVGNGDDAGFGAERGSFNGQDGEESDQFPAMVAIDAICPECAHEQKVWLSKEQIRG